MAGSKATEGRRDQPREYLISRLKHFKLSFAFLSDFLSCNRILTLSCRQFHYHGCHIFSWTSSIRWRSISNEEVSSDDLDFLVLAKGRTRRRRENGNIPAGEADQRHPRSTQFIHPRWRHVSITAISARRRGDCLVADCVLFRVLPSIEVFVIARDVWRGCACHDDNNVWLLRCHVSMRKRSSQFIGHETKTFKTRGLVYPAGKDFVKCWLHS